MYFWVKRWRKELFYCMSSQSYILCMQLQCNNLTHEKCNNLPHGDNFSRNARACIKNSRPRSSTNMTDPINIILQVHFKFQLYQFPIVAGYFWRKLKMFVFVLFLGGGPHNFFLFPSISSPNFACKACLKKKKSYDITELLHAVFHLLRKRKPTYANLYTYEPTYWIEHPTYTGCPRKSGTVDFQYLAS